MFFFGNWQPIGLTKNESSYLVSFGNFVSVGQTFAVITAESRGQLDPINQGLLGLSYNGGFSLSPVEVAAIHPSCANQMPFPTMTSRYTFRHSLMKDSLSLPSLEFI